MVEVASSGTGGSNVSTPKSISLYSGCAPPDTMKIFDGVKSRCNSETAARSHNVSRHAFAMRSDSIVPMPAASRARRSFSVSP